MTNILLTLFLICVILVRVILPSVIQLSAILLNVVAPQKARAKRFEGCNPQQHQVMIINVAGTFGLIGELYLGLLKEYTLSG